MKAPPPKAQWLRSLSARMVLLNMAVTTGLSALMILTLCLLAESFMQAHLDDTVLDEVHVLEAELNIDGLRGVSLLIKQRLATNLSGRQAYLLLDREGRKLAGNLDAMPDHDVRRESWPDLLALRMPVVSTLRSNIQTGKRGGIASAGGGTQGRWHALPTLHQPVDATLRLRSTRLIDGSHLVVGYDDKEIAVFIEALQRAAVIGFAITLALGFLAGALSTRLTLRQIDTINRTANRIIDGDLNQRVPLRGSQDEFDRLGSTLNQMLDRINELMNSVRYATESIAHDLRSPLTRMRNRIETARNEAALSPAGQKEFVEQLAGEVDRVLTVFSSLLRLATIESGVLRSGFHRLDLRPLIDDAASLYDALASEREINLSTVVSPNGHDGVSVDGDRNLLFQSICNLLDNAVKFSPDGAEVRVELAVEQGQARIRIRDHGPGIPADQRERVFDRLVRLDSSRGSPGFGLGLSLVRGIARLHRGDCRLLDGSPGTLAVLELPLAT